MSLRSSTRAVVLTVAGLVTLASSANAGRPSLTGETWLPPRRGLYGDPFLENNAFHPSAAILYKWNNPHHKHGHFYGYGYGRAGAYAPGAGYGHPAGCPCGHCAAGGGSSSYVGGHHHGRLDYAPYRYQPNPMIYGVYVP